MSRSWQGKIGDDATIIARAALQGFFENQGGFEDMGSTSEEGAQRFPSRLAAVKAVRQVLAVLKDRDAGWPERLKSFLVLDKPPKGG